MDTSGQYFNVTEENVGPVGESRRVQRQKPAALGPRATVYVQLDRCICTVS